jgi:AraC-like DNA-binding protein
MADYQWYILLNSLGVIHITVLCLYLTLRKNNVLANKLLAAALAIPGLYMVDNLLICSRTIAQVPYAFFFVQIIANFFPIVVYRYIHLLLVDHKKIPRILFIGSVFTFMASFVLTLFFASLSPVDQEHYLSSLTSETYPLSMNVYNLLFYIWQMVYLGVLYWELREYKSKVENNLTNTDGVKLRFAQLFINVLALLNFSLIFLYILLPNPIVDYGAIPIVLTIIYSCIIFYLLRNNAVFSQSSYQNLQQENNDLYASVKDSTAVESTSTKLSEIVLKLEKALHEAQLYLNPQLKLYDLARHIDEPAYLTSQCINTHYKKSFYDFINELRVDEAKTLLKSFDPKKDTIENVAYQSGFNSRASFYRAFKKMEGKNPTNFVSKG